MLMVHEGTHTYIEVIPPPCVLFVKETRDESRVLCHLQLKYRPERVEREREREKADRQEGWWLEGGGHINKVEIIYF